MGGVTVTAVPAYNIDKFRAPGEVFHPRAAGGLGYVVELDGRRIYHAGDTDAIPEMSDVRCDVALLPVSGTYVMTAEEAAEACGMIAAAVVVPMHFGDIVGTAADAARFEELCGPIAGRTDPSRLRRAVHERSCRARRPPRASRRSSASSVSAKRWACADLRANVFTLAEGSMSRHLHREQEEVYLVLDGTAMIDVDGSSSRWESARRSRSRRAPGTGWRTSALGPLTFFVAAAPAVDDDAEIER